MKSLSLAKSSRFVSRPAQETGILLDWLVDQQAFSGGKHRRCRQSDRKRRTRAHFALYVYLSLVRADNAGNKTEPQSEPFLRVRVGNSVEAIKDVRQMVGRDT